jgi:hypothetical protein
MRGAQRRGKNRLQASGPPGRPPANTSGRQSKLKARGPKSVMCEPGQTWKAGRTVASRKFLHSRSEHKRIATCLNSWQNAVRILAYEALR